MNTRFHIFVAVTAMCLFAFGCEPRDTKLAPPSIHYGQSICDGCGMIVSDEHYAAALIVKMPDGERRAVVFDDIGCMLDYQRAHDEWQILGQFVKDINDGTWLTVNQATFVRGDAVHSPMAYGIAAYSTPAAAQSWISSHGGSIQSIESLLENKPAVSANSAATQSSVIGGKAS